MYNLSTSTEIQVTTSELNQDCPAIYGDRIVWADSRNGNSDIYMFTFGTPEKDPVEELKDLRACINALNLHPSAANVFDTRLKSAICYLEKGDEDKALKSLESLIECVYSMQEKGRVEDKEAEHIIGEAQRIISLIKNS
jgi:beta propeller repeat protein